MATVPGPLIWEIVKRNNSFLVKEFGNGTASVQFSKREQQSLQPQFLQALSSLCAWLANKKTVTIQPGGKDKDQSVCCLQQQRLRSKAKPSSLLHKSVMKKEFRRMAKAVTNQWLMMSIPIILELTADNGVQLMGIGEALSHIRKSLASSGTHAHTKLFGGNEQLEWEKNPTRQFLHVGDNYYRPDLKKAALARLSAVHRSLKVAKSGVKKRNRQA
ncbi:ribosomal L28e protein family [Actinidia rufa]|uniref:Ribosomal L28e protein family n=1 Tax=Actinidia rufa TaxID=165716 RepID=A0A7J0G0Y5_9ERIC|nr:ribosomal L28e protein family [Actinidia rufa]